MFGHSENREKKLKSQHNRKVNKTDVERKKLNNNPVMANFLYFYFYFFSGTKQRRVRVYLEVRVGYGDSCGSRDSGLRGRNHVSRRNQAEESRATEE